MTSGGLSVIIPAYNEERAIGAVVTSVFDALSGKVPGSLEVIVVDDGSTDGTAAAVPSGAVLVRHPKNTGYGRSLLSGIDRASHDLIAIIDADGTYDPHDFGEMLPLSDTYDMIIGARRIEKQTVFVKALRLLLRSIILYFTGHHSPDPNSGMRIFRRDIVTSGRELFSLKFSFSTSLTVYSCMTNRFVSYVPIGYGDRTGISKVRHVRDSLRTFFLILSMGLMFRSGHCIFAQMILFLLGGGLLAVFGLIGPGFWGIATGITWIVLHLTVLAAFQAYIMSRLYERLRDRP
ncbi:MAG TPA: glycosyltransferase family 2 protein [Candidatus Ozemobacteraceae bacterium]|nr:glycosyltransferase family 2 protein [Candidatus Ozemobacteraceae bacterium]